MRKASKILAGILSCAMLIGSASSALAWEDSDIINDGGNEIIVPLQVPEITLGPTFSPDSETPDHNGETGNVYTGKVSIAKAGQQTIILMKENTSFLFGLRKEIQIQKVMKTQTVRII